jgi:hypothetical protein
MGYHNFASSGYVALNPLQPGECFVVDSGVWLTFDVKDRAANNASMTFTRPRNNADRALAVASTPGLSSPPDQAMTTMTRGGAIVTAIVSFFEMALYLASSTASAPVSRGVTVLGLGLDDGHRGSRERHIDTFEDAVRSRGQSWLARYKEKLQWGGFFVESSKEWYTRGAIASQHDVMILRLDSTYSNLEISGFVNDRQARLCRLVKGIAVRTGPQLTAPGH